MQYTTHTLEETKEVAQKFVEFLRQNTLNSNKYNTGHCNVFGFSGDLGSGKTTFTKAVAEILGVIEHVTSPTFVIQKRYSINSPEQGGKPFPYKTIIHIDAYRLESYHELENLSFAHDQAETQNVEGYLLHKNLILIEWPEKVEGLTDVEGHPLHVPIIKFSHPSSEHGVEDGLLHEGVRTIKFPDMMTV